MDIIAHDPPVKLHWHLNNGTTNHNYLCVCIHVGLILSDIICNGIVDVDVT